MGPGCRWTPKLESRRQVSTSIKWSGPWTVAATARRPSGERATCRVERRKVISRVLRPVAISQIVG